VPGELNPADILSQGCSPLQLVHSKWWLGPSWLYKPVSDWSVAEKDFDEKEIDNRRRSLFDPSRLGILFIDIGCQI